jgi:hypothetical protein
VFIVQHIEVALCFKLRTVSYKSNWVVAEVPMLRQVSLPRIDRPSIDPLMIRVLIMGPTSTAVASAAGHRSGNDARSDPNHSF